MTTVRKQMTERKGIPPEWEPYLTGQVAAEPTAASWVREAAHLVWDPAA